MESHRRKEEESVLAETKVLCLIPGKKIFFEPRFALNSKELESDL